MTYHDSDILEAIRTGKNNKVLAYLYNEILPKVKTYICNNSGKEEDADDIFQDAVMILYKHVKQKKFNEKYEIAGFLYSICRNLWINKAKRDKRSITMEKQADFQEPGDFFEDIVTEEREQLINEAFEKLGKKCKEVLVCSIYHEMSLKEICEKMGFKNENAAKTKKYKCKQQLIEFVKNHPGFKRELQK